MRWASPPAPPTIRTTGGTAESSAIEIGRESLRRTVRRDTGPHRSSSLPSVHDAAHDRTRRSVVPPIFLTADQVADRLQGTPIRLLDARPVGAYVAGHAAGAASLPAAALNPVVEGVRTLVGPEVLARTLSHA